MVDIAASQRSRGVSRKGKEVRGMAAIAVGLMAIVILFAFGITVVYFAMRLIDKLFWQKGSETDEERRKRSRR